MTPGSGVEGVRPGRPTNALRQFGRPWTRDRRVLAMGAGASSSSRCGAGVGAAGEARDGRLRTTAAANDLAYLRRGAAWMPPLPPRDGRSLLALVDATARASGVGEALLRVEPVSAAQVRVYFEGAGFDALVDWLAALQAGQRMSISDFSATRSTGVGRVDARVVLERPGG